MHSALLRSILRLPASRFAKATGWIVLFGIFSGGLQAQNDTFSVLPATEIYAAKLRRQPAGTHAGLLDSAGLSSYADRSVAEAISGKNGVYLKNYGPGSISTTSVRGGSASQTAIVWNGLPLQSPMLGQLDFSLLPVVFADEVTVQYGGHGAAWGSGAIGGAVLIDNKTQAFNGLSAKISSSAGSFGWQHYATALHYGKDGKGGSTRFFTERSDNNFPFRAHPDLPVKKQEHALFRQNGLLQEFFWQVKPGQEFAVRTWWQHAEREIPPTTVQTASGAVQMDAFIRLAIHWKKTGKQAVWQTRHAFFSERLDYSDAQLGIDAANNFRTWINEAEATWLPRASYRVQGAVSHTFTRASASAYQNPPRQNRTAMFGAVCRDWGQWRVQIDGRVEIVDRKILPFSPAFGLEIKPFSGMAIKLKAARSFRLPTFNDRFWQPGGDPGLSPESGWSKEAGLVFHLKTGSVRWQAGATGYDRRIRNWILWARQNGQPFFSPQNIAEVWSRGIESRIEAGIDMARWAVALSAGYDFARSTNEKTIGTPKIEKGAQLPYVPQHRVFGECAIQIRYLRLTLYQEYTGAVTGINQPVPGFGIGSLRAAYRLPFNRWLGAVFFYAGNLWNARYEVIERRPMPGRHFRAGFQAGVAKSGKQKHSTQ